MEKCLHCDSDILAPSGSLRQCEVCGFITQREAPLIGEEFYQAQKAPPVEAVPAAPQTQDARLTNMATCLGMPRRLNEDDAALRSRLQAAVQKAPPLGLVNKYVPNISDAADATACIVREVREVHTVFSKDVWGVFERPLYETVWACCTEAALCKELAHHEDGDAIGRAAAFANRPAAAVGPMLK